MNRRIVLINAPAAHHLSMVKRQTYFPLALLYLGGVLRRAGMDVSVFDVNNQTSGREDIFEEEAFRRYLREELMPQVCAVAPDVIGIGGLFSGAFKYQMLIAAEVRRMFPDQPIVIGGIHATIFAEEILRRYSAVDYVVLGEGEESFLQLVQRVTGGIPVDDVDGIVFRVGDRIQTNSKQRFIEDLDALPGPDYSLIRLQDYAIDTSDWYSPRKIPVGRPFPVITSRSCPNRCSFCSMWLVQGPKIRYRSAVRVVDELQRLHEEHGATYFEFMDDNLTHDRRRILEICDGIRQRNLKIQFCTPNGVAVRSLDSEVVQSMVDAGLVRIALAIESGSEYIRNQIMHKGLKTEKIYEVAELCARHRELYIIGFFVVGMPEENAETLEETYQMIKRLPLDQCFAFLATPYPGTALFEQCLRDKLFRCDPGNFIETENLQYHTDTPHIQPYHLRVEEIVSFRAKCDAFSREKRIASGVPSRYPLRYFQGRAPTL